MDGPIFKPVARPLPQGVDPASLYGQGPAAGLPAGTDPREYQRTAGGNVEAQVYNGLIQRGLPPHVASAFVLNFKDESGLNPGINEIAPLVPGSRGGYGLYQLTGPRRRAYEAYASERGVPLDSVDAQLDFMMMELQGPEARAREKIFAAQNTGDAAAAVVNYFLRPAESHRAKREARYRGTEYVPPEGGNALAGTMPMQPGPMQPQNQLAAEPPQWQYNSFQNDPMAFMRGPQNALARQI